MTVVLIPCSAQKARHPAPARELYTGRLFQKSLAWAYRKFGPGVEVAVLSAKHGLVSLDQIIAPYDHRLERSELPAWAERTRAQLVARYPGAHFVALVSQVYAKALEGLDFERPFAGLRVNAFLGALRQ